MEKAPPWYCLSTSQPYGIVIHSLKNPLRGFLVTPQNDNSIHELKTGLLDGTGLTDLAVDKGK